MKSLGETPFKFYNACAALALFTTRNGGAGFSGINANFYPQLITWLSKNPDHESAPALQRSLGIAENVVMYKYPNSAKVFLGMFHGVEIAPRCRANDVVLNEEEVLKVEMLHHEAHNWCTRLGIPYLNPLDCSPVPQAAALPNSMGL